MREATSSVSLKLVIDAEGQRVLLAEAGKDFVDFLFYILSLPVAKLISLYGGLGNQFSPPGKRLYDFGSSSYYVADDPSALRPNCSGSSKHVLEESGLVKGTVKYMVMDDLDVKPMSTSSFTTLLKTFDIKNVAALEEREVILGMNEAVKLVKAALETNRVLTRVFLNVGGDVDEEKIKLILSKVKDITELIASGWERLASVPAGGGGVADLVVGDAGGGAAAAESKEEEKGDSDDVIFQYPLVSFSSTKL